MCKGIVRIKGAEELRQIARREGDISTRKLWEMPDLPGKVPYIIKRLCVSFTTLVVKCQTLVLFLRRIYYQGSMFCVPRCNSGNGVPGPS